MAVTITPASAQGLVNFDSADPTVATVAGSAPTITVAAVAAGVTVVRAKIGSSVCASANVLVQAPTLDVTVDGGPTFYITPAPAMPNIIAHARVLGINPDPTATALIDWTYSIYLPPSHLGRSVPKNGPYSQSSGSMVGANHTVVFDTILGGNLTLRASATITYSSGQQVTTCGELSGLLILGQNPDLASMSTLIGDSTLRKIICYENRRDATTPRQPRQFQMDGYPFWSPDGNFGAGIGQITPASDDQVWDWTVNVDAAIQKLAETRASAAAFPKRIQGSQSLATLLQAYNTQVRIPAGRASLVKVTVPASLPDPERDAIRGYNGYDGSDSDFPGFELHEYRIRRVSGPGSVLWMSSINETTLEGTLEWELVPESARPPASVMGDPVYVAGVLNFPTCGL